MKKRRPTAVAFEPRETARTGHHCPRAGWWSIAGDPRSLRFISKGEVMPAHGGTPILWILRAASEKQPHSAASALIS